MALLWLLSGLIYYLLLTTMAPTVETARHHQQQQTSAACTACRIAHGSCPLRSGLFTRSQLPAGLNLVATVPRGACNINVTEVKPSTNSLAIRTHRDARFVLTGDYVTESVVTTKAAGSHITYTQGNFGRGETLWMPGPINEPIDILLNVKQSNPGIHYQYHVPTAIPSVDGFPTAALQPSTIIAAPWSQGDVDENDVAWRVAGLTPCSQSCGGGEQQTVFACMRGLHVTLPPSHCDGMPQPDDVTMRCNTKPCPAQWETGEWGPCSVSCGSGIQTRPIMCRQLISASLTIKVAEGACLATPPERSRRCHVRPCQTATEFTWSVSPWGLCSAECGQGVRTRRVWCIGDQDVEFPDIRCQAAMRPLHEEPCDAGSCIGNLWLFTEWTQQCSARCGPGVQHRRLHCSGGSANAVLPEDESQCDPRSKPSESRACQGECEPAWFHGPWEECPDSCDTDGVAYQTRSVVCVQWTRGQMRVVLDSRCAALERPTSRKPCAHQPSACRATWFFSTWGPCSGPCGSGHRTREVQCIDIRLQMPSIDCAESERPISMETCEPEHCGGTRNRSHANNNGTSVSSCGPDKVRNCALVVQARLCQYPYYRRACCAACSAKHDSE